MPLCDEPTAAVLQGSNYEKLPDRAGYTTDSDMSPQFCISPYCTGSLSLSGLKPYSIMRSLSSFICTTCTATPFIPLIWKRRHSSTHIFNPSLQPYFSRPGPIPTSIMRSLPSFPCTASTATMSIPPKRDAHSSTHIFNLWIERKVKLYLEESTTEIFKMKLPWSNYDIKFTK